MKLRFLGTSAGIATRRRFNTAMLLRAESGLLLIDCGEPVSASLLRLGILPESYAALGRKTMNGILDRYVTFEDGKMELGGICLVAGLGPEKDRRRDGSYEYYISEPVVKNDAKGVAPVLLCFAELLRSEA